MFTTKALWTITALGLGTALQLGPQQDDSQVLAPTRPQLTVRRGPGSASPAMLALSSTDPLFLAGMELFDKPFHRSTGGGAPNMNADSCRGCHQDPFIGGSGGLELNVSRFGDDGNGTQAFQDVPGGQMLSKLQPPFHGDREEYDPATATVFEQRQTPTIFGAGLIDGIADAEILANEDPDDLDGDGIRGVARRLQVAGATEIGRFGWKAQIPRLRDFVMDATGGELGLTTPDDGRGFAMVSDADSVADPELSPSDVDLLEHFMANLPAPRRDLTLGGRPLAGLMLFEQVGCAKCHVPELQGASGPVPLYSDLLLHDVMADDFRGMAEDGAGVGMYRTPPLWGIRDTAPYMHDGRAATLEEAILAHEGEAAPVSQAFFQLSPADQALILAFLQVI